MERDDKGFVSFEGKKAAIVFKLSQWQEILAMADLFEGVYFIAYDEIGECYLEHITFDGEVIDELRIPSGNASILFDEVTNLPNPDGMQTYLFYLREVKGGTGNAKLTFNQWAKGYDINVADLRTKPFGAEYLLKEEEAYDKKVQSLLKRVS